jgi:hypothetical protein
VRGGAGLAIAALPIAPQGPNHVSLALGPFCRAVADIGLQTLLGLMKSRLISPARFLACLSRRFTTFQVMREQDCIWEAVV